MKKKVLKVLLILLILIIIIVTVLKVIDNNKIKNNALRADKVIKNIIKDKEYEVILEINPKMSLLIKNGKVDHFNCLNDDCNMLDTKFVGMELKDAVSSIYKDANEKGFDTSKGVVLKSKEILDLGLNYVIYEDLEDEKEEIKEESVSKLDEFKKDEDYGIYYECTENPKLSCHIKEDIEIDLSSITSYIDGTIPKMRGIERVLNRFGIKSESIKEMGILERPAYYIYINGIKFAQVGGTTVKELEYLGNYNCSDHRFKLMDLDLLNPSSIKEKYFNSKFDITPGNSEGNYSENDFCPYDLDICYYERKIEISACNLEKGFFEKTGEIRYRYFKGSENDKIEITKDEYDNIINKYISFY